MGRIISPTGYLYDDTDWYFVRHHQYFKIGGPPCDNWVANISCCKIGWDIKFMILAQCLQGTASCGTFIDASFKITDIDGPYDSEAMCLAGNPDPPVISGIYTNNISYVLSEVYNFFPASGGKFEMTIPDYGNAWGFFATGDKNLKLHIRFDPIEVSESLS